jgi:hypothetical protein
MEHVYFWWRESDGLQPLFFSKPTFRAKFENDDDTNGKLLSIDVTGFTSQAIMVNSEVDVAGTISDEALWGGLGDEDLSAASREHWPRMLSTSSGPQAIRWPWRGVPRR